jgi:hypothetical protein
MGNGAWVGKKEPMSGVGWKETPGRLPQGFLGRISEVWMKLNLGK